MDNRQGLKAAGFPAGRLLPSPLFLTTEAPIGTASGAVLRLLAGEPTRPSVAADRPSCITRTSKGAALGSLPGLSGEPAKAYPQPARATARKARACRSARGVSQRRLDRHSLGPGQAHAEGQCAQCRRGEDRPEHRAGQPGRGAVQPENREHPSRHFLRQCFAVAPAQLAGRAESGRGGRGGTAGPAAAPTADPGAGIRQRRLAPAGLRSPSRPPLAGPARSLTAARGIRLRSPNGAAHVSALAASLGLPSIGGCRLGKWPRTQPLGLRRSLHSGRRLRLTVGASPR